MELQEYLETVTRLTKRCHSRDSMIYSGIEDLLCQRGKHFKMRLHDPTLDMAKRGLSKLCFANCAQAVLDYPSRYRYCEGFALSTVPIHHAWLEDILPVPSDVSGVEITWQNLGDEYIGVTFTSEEVLTRALELEYLGSMLTTPSGKLDPRVFGGLMPEDVKLAAEGALRNLGYTKQEAHFSVESVAPSLNARATAGEVVEAVIRTRRSLRRPGGRYGY